MIIRRAILALFLTTLVIPSIVKADTTITDVYLYGPGGTGGTTSVSTSTNTSVALGNAGGSNLWQTQSFMASAGLFSQFSVVFTANTGSPSGTVTWILASNNSSVPGSTLETGTFTPTANSTHTETIPSPSTFLYPNTTYWLLFKSTVNQSTGVFWTLRQNTLDVYANGQAGATSNAGSSWSIQTNGDLIITVTTVVGAAGSDYLNDQVAQSFTVGGYVTATAVKLDLKKFGSPTGVITLNIESDTGNNPSGYLIDDGATGTLSESSLTTSYALTEITLDSPVELQPGIKYWIVIETDRTDSTDYVALGSTSDCIVDQYLKVHNQGVWKSEDTTGIFEFTLSSEPVQPNASKSFVLMPSGNTAEISMSASAGETAVFVLLIVLVVIKFFDVFMKARST